MKTIGIIILVLIATLSISMINFRNDTTMLANGGITTIIQSDGTIKTCTEIGSGSTSVIVCN